MNELRGPDAWSAPVGFRQVDFGGGWGTRLGALVVCNRIV